MVETLSILGIGLVIAFIMFCLLTTEKIKTEYSILTRYDKFFIRKNTFYKLFFIKWSSEKNIITYYDQFKADNTMYFNTQEEAEKWVENDKQTDKLNETKLVKKI